MCAAIEVGRKLGESRDDADEAGGERKGPCRDCCRLQDDLQFVSRSVS